MSDIIAVILALLDTFVRVLVGVPVLFWAIGQWLGSSEKAKEE